MIIEHAFVPCPPECCGGLCHFYGCGMERLKHHGSYPGGECCCETHAVQRDGFCVECSEHLLSFQRAVSR